MTHPSLPGQDALGFSPDGSIARLYFVSRFWTSLSTLLLVLLWFFLRLPSRFPGPSESG